MRNKGGHELNISKILSSEWQLMLAPPTLQLEEGEVDARRGKDFRVCVRK